MTLHENKLLFKREKRSALVCAGLRAKNHTSVEKKCVSVGVCVVCVRPSHHQRYSVIGMALMGPSLRILMFEGVPR